MVMSCNVDDVCYVWGDADNDNEVVFIAHQVDPNLIECHPSTTLVLPWYFPGTALALS